MQALTSALNFQFPLAYSRFFNNQAQLGMILMLIAILFQIQNFIDLSNALIYGNAKNCNI